MHNYYTGSPKGCYWLYLISEEWYISQSHQPYLILVPVVSRIKSYYSTCRIFPGININARAQLSCSWIEPEAHPRKLNFTDRVITCRDLIVDHVARVCTHLWASARSLYRLQVSISRYNTPPKYDLVLVHATGLPMPPTKFGRDVASKAPHQCLSLETTEKKQKWQVAY